MSPSASSYTVSRCYQFTAHERLPHNIAEREPSLWDDNGDCFIYLDNTNSESVSFRIQLSTLKDHHSTVLLKSIRSTDRAHSPRSCDGSDSGYESSHLNRLSIGLSEVHISTPVGLSTREVALYHITTRNYFAYLLGKPLVGPSLGLAARDVWQRIQRWHAEQAKIESFLDYCQAQGYMNLVGNPYNATAMLAFAESARSRSLWINAYAHCVAMHDRIDKDSDFDALTNTTKALITKGSLEMELHIRRVVRTVGNFLEGELGSEKLGLSKSARDHLDHFRSCLHTFFLDKLGYFPPADSEDNFDKDIWRDIHDDFKAMYDYLADTETVNDVLSDRGVIGGVCVQQNVDAFNQRHSFEPLIHPLPLLPNMTPTRRATESQVSLRSFLVRIESDFRPSVRQALADASNTDNAESLERPIVQEYMRFERQKLEEKLSIAEARKVRWLLIYCTLQMLTSIVSAPAEVTNAQSAPYSLCVNASACPIWSDDALPRTVSAASMRNMTLTIPSQDDTDRISIHPDCEADNAHDFFSHQRRSSVVEKSEDEEPQSATRTTAPPLSRSLSIRTSVHSSMNAFQKTIGSMSRRNSSRRSAQLVPRRMSSLQDIDAQDDEEVIAETPVDGFAFDFVTSPAKTSDDLDSPVPTLEAHQLDMIAPVERCITPETQHREEERFSPVSDSSRRSSLHSEYDTPITEPSSRSNSIRESRLLGKLAPLDEDSILITPARRVRPGFHTSASTSSLNIGCYVPSGIVRAESPKVPVSKFAAPQRRQVYERRQEEVNSPLQEEVKRPLQEEVKRPLQKRYGKSPANNAGQHGRYTWGDMP